MNDIVWVKVKETDSSWLPIFNQSLQVWALGDRALSWNSVLNQQVVDNRRNDWQDK